MQHHCRVKDERPQEPPQPLLDDGDKHPAQKRMLEALTAPAASTVEHERRCRNNAILAVIAYGPIQKTPYLTAPEEGRRRSARGMSLERELPRMKAMKRTRS